MSSILTKSAELHELHRPDKSACLSFRNLEGSNSSQTRVYPLQFKVKGGTSHQHCSAFPKLFPGYNNKMADTEVIETKEARVVERTPAVSGVNGPIGTATNASINGESPADENDVGTTEVTIRSVSNDDANSSVYAEEIVDIIAIGSAVSPIKPPDIRTNQDGGEY